MTAAAWMPMYWADYLADTMHLSTFQHGCYLLLIAAYWRKGGPIPADPKYLAQVCRTSNDKLARYGNPVLAMFTCKDGLLRHERIEKELLRSSDRLAAAVANGRAGGLAKAKLPHPTPQEVDKKVLINEMLNGVGKNGLRRGNGHVTVQDPLDRIARFQKSIVPHLKDGWLTIDAAMRPAKVGYEDALAQCQAAARKIGKGWPRNWPLQNSET